MLSVRSLRRSGAPSVPVGRAAHAVDGTRSARRQIGEIRPTQRPFAGAPYPPCLAGRATAACGRGWRTARAAGYGAVGVRRFLGQVARRALPLASLANGLDGFAKPGYVDIRMVGIAIAFDNTDMKARVL